MHQHKNMRGIFFFLTVLFLLAACNQEQEKDAERLLTGDDSKTWKTDQKNIASGEDRALTQPEGEQQISFNEDGTFELRNQSGTRTGTWTYSPSERTLELVFDDRPAITESYYVNRLEEDTLNIRDPDGATMQYTST